MTDVATTEPRSALLKIDDGVPWKMLEQYPWREASCKGMVVDYDCARHIYIAMRPPRSIKRCKDELDWLGFVAPGNTTANVMKDRSISVGTLRGWSIKGDWARDARLHDMGMSTIEELQRRVAGLRDAALIPLVESLTETMMAAMDAEKIELAATKAAEKGDIKGMMDAAKMAAELIGYVTGGAEQASVPPPQVHQHQHVHLDANGQPAAPVYPSGALSRVLTPFARTKDRLDQAAAQKRAAGTEAKKPNGHANGATINGKAKEVEDGDGHG